jgi:SpoVK/Ycf46/Vps4 family AAA+-type ATPase
MALARCGALSDLINKESSPMHELFDEIFDLPDPEKSRKFQGLVGIDEAKERLFKEGQLLLNPRLLDEWSRKHHGTLIPAVGIFHHRPPLMVFAGDIGTGKTTFANSFGDPIARAEKIPVKVLRLSLMTRGTGAVGEMTRLITRAFHEVEQLARQGTQPQGKPRSACIMVIDEADAIAQSREFDQMHHEDRAGVNALIRGIDRFTDTRLPVIVVMCTNRISAIDPAVLRRAAAVFTFERPNDTQRAHVLKGAFGSIFTDNDLQTLVTLTGPRDGCNYGYTYSDLTQRFIPSVLLAAFPHHPLTLELAATLAEKTKPTRPFTSLGTAV